MDELYTDILALIAELRENRPRVDTPEVGQETHSPTSDPVESSADPNGDGRWQTVLDSLEAKVRQCVQADSSQEEIWLHEMATASPLGIVRLSEDGRIMYANPRALKMLGVEASELETGLYLLEFVSSEQFHETAARLRQEESSGRVSEPLTGCLRRRDGTHMTVELHGAVAHDPATGEVVGFWGMFRDATAEVRAEEIQQARVRLQTDLAMATDLESAMDKVIEAAMVLDGVDSGCVFSLDPLSSTVGIIAERGFSDDMVRYINTWARESSEREAMFSREIGRCWSVDYEKLKRRSEAVIDQEGMRSLVMTPLWRTGEAMMVLVARSDTLDQIPDETCAALEEMMGQVLDVVARTRAEEDRRTAVEQFEAVFQTSPLAMYVLDLDGRVVMWSESATRMFGWEKSEVMGKLSPFIHDNNLEEFRGNLQRALDGVGMYGQEFERQTRDGESLNLLIYAAALHDRDGAPVGLLTIAQDITEMKQADEAKQRIGLLESLGVLAGGIAHDFNNILMVITGNLSLAQMEADSELLNELLGEAHEAARKAVGLTARLVTFSKGGTPVKEEIDLEAIINRVVSRVLGGTPGIRTEMSLGAVRVVEADSVQLREALRSLVARAQEAMGEEGMLRISTEDVRESDGTYHVRISIEDDGQDIPPSMMGRIFDPYFSTKSAKPGLGLSAAHSVISQHEGSLTVRPRPGGGSIFDVTLPASATLDEEDTAESEVQQGSEKVEVGQSAKVLVVDDEDMVRSVLVRMLERLGCSVEGCASGEEAIEVYREAEQTTTPFSIVITDLMMPGGMDGVETADALHDINPRLKVVVSSGYSDDPVLAEYAAHGFCGSVRKPYSLESLREVLETCGNRS